MKESARRARMMRDELRRRWVGLGDLTDWLLAAVIARENVLLLGTPGTAKTEIALSTFQLLGLDEAKGLDQSDERRAMIRPRREGDDPFAWWNERQELERQSHKYFHYLLSQFTQPEELFGPLEISLLRQGLSVRVNFGLMTGAGVRAVFLDEVFKAASTILNTLLTLTMERRHFNWGGMVASDISLFIGASNELPGGLATGTYGMGAGAEDFQTLYAFLDRFPIRLMVPAVSGLTQNQDGTSDLGKATGVAVRREATRLATTSPFNARSVADMPTINDFLLLGRCLLDHEIDGHQGIFSDGQRLNGFFQAFVKIGGALNELGTSVKDARVTWTISPRKLKALYKIALAHALVCDEDLATRKRVRCPGPDDMRVFELIWDTPLEAASLESEVRSAVRQYLGSTGRAAS